ncbi:MAG: tRNA lysidine(34) synthetase TilS [Bacteroidota bacterium]
MLDKFLAYLKKKNLFTQEQPILLAVSGGVDSILLCHLFHRAKLSFGIAHCNFTLRGEESDKDEQFVSDLAQQVDVPFHSIRFETLKITQERKQSIQEVARNLRYDWLEQIRVKESYDFIATAHHLSDSIETALFNFGRGSGIRGLHGIQAKFGKIIRPLLFATKKELEEYTKKENLTWRHDASNDTDKYSRNKIRHHIIPAFQEICPTFEQKAAETIEHLKAVEQIFDWSITHFKAQVWSEKNENSVIDLEKLSSCPSPETILFELVKTQGFHRNQIPRMLDSKIGSQFFSSTHELLIDRNQLIIRAMNSIVSQEFIIISSTTSIALEDAELNFQILTELPDHFPNDQHTAYFDYDQLTFPLKLRHWKAGDRFQPLGMNGKSKKVQDFFSDLKLNRFEKEQVWLLESDGKICWLLAYRMDERFKLTKKTQKVLRIEIG